MGHSRQRVAGARRRSIAEGPTYQHLGLHGRRVAQLGAHELPVQVRRDAQLREGHGRDHVRAGATPRGRLRGREDGRRRRRDRRRRSHGRRGRRRPRGAHRRGEESRTLAHPSRRRERAAREAHEGGHPECGAEVESEEPKGSGGRSSLDRRVGGWERKHDETRVQKKEEGRRWGSLLLLLLLLLTLRFSGRTRRTAMAAYRATEDEPCDSLVKGACPAQAGGMCLNTQIRSAAPEVAKGGAGGSGAAAECARCCPLSPALRHVREVRRAVRRGTGAWNPRRWRGRGIIERKE